MGLCGSSMTAEEKQAAANSKKLGSFQLHATPPARSTEEHHEKD